MLKNNFILLCYKYYEILSFKSYKNIFENVRNNVAPERKVTGLVVRVEDTRMPCRRFASYYLVLLDNRISSSYPLIQTML